MELASLHRNLQNTPSIFEITAAETLDDLIYPALKRVLNYLNALYKLKWSQNQIISRVPSIVVNRIFTPEVITWCIQYLYLKKRDASLGECFYGLQRFNDNSGTIISLTNKQKVISATILTTLSCVTTKLQEKAQQHEISSLQEYILKALHLYRLYKAWHLLKYLLRATVTPSPIFNWLKLLLLYPLKEKGSNREMKKSKMINVFFVVLEIVSFLLQFSHKWYDSSSSNTNLRKFGNRANPPAPFVEQDTSLNLPDGVCPLCYDTINNPTASMISGYVYCWRCIMNHLESKETCPITGHAMSIEDLIRIYIT